SIAQTLSPDWAKQINGSQGGGTTTYGDITTDKEGNVYALYNEQGYVYAGGQATQDSTSTTVLTSWDCNGSLRWMKSLGVTGNVGARNTGMYLEVDTLGGIYVSGSATSQGTAGFYWDTDTTINIAGSASMEYLMKYNSQGQFQWFRTLAANYMQNPSIRLSASPSGDLFWFALLDPGLYGGGAFTITTRKYYAVRYSAAGSFQAAIPLDMTPPASTTTPFSVSWKFDPSTNRFYSWLSYTNNYGSLTIGNTTIASPANGTSGTAVLSAFDGQGQNLWVKQASTNKTSRIDDIAFNTDGVLYIKGESEPGTVFCGDTATNASGQSPTACLMSLDTNGGLFWSNYSANGQLGGGFFNVSQVNNTLVTTGRYYGTLTWNNHSVTSTSQNYSGYLLQADAATGIVQQLASFDASTSCTPQNTALDKNGNTYITGFFQGNMSFGGNTFSSTPAWSFNHFLLKYKNVNCGCDLLLPAFNATHTGGKTYQCTYTGQTPYTTISWDFGDGSPTLFGVSPSHTYAAYGTYSVCVTVTNACGSNTTCQYITIDPTGIDDATGIFSSVSVYPNPANNEVMIDDLASGTTVEILDMLGRRLKKATSDGTTLHISLLDLNAGVHLLRFTNKEGQSGSQMFVKQ
ncbi:MAG TPA: PKD domain-containing protein, partial [Flavipsychrobacter sp.]|nr:PKD domain-containing protein [Flavipsychrobacter sp.]